MSVSARSFQVVFTSSESLVHRLLTNRSAKSRLGDVVEVGDPSVEQATSYLKCCEVEPHLVSAVINVTGTRFQELRSTAAALLRGTSLDERLARLFWDVTSELQWLGVSSTPLPTRGQLNDAFWKIVDGIVRNGSVSKKFFDDAAPGRQENDILSSSNIFLLDNKNKQVSFQSRPVELYMRAETGVFEEQCAEPAEPGSTTTN